ncbi:MAG: tetratricopeptide repeat protein [bacterium]|nr:tetratricopeptide repeat protein [bacterium]
MNHDPQRYNDHRRFRAPGTKRSAGARLVGLALLVGCASSAGCTTFEERRAKAELHWNQVRSGMKLQLAAQQYQRGQLHAAIATAEEAVATDNTSVEAYLLLARCRLEQGQVASARRAVQQARGCAPGSSEVEYLLGLIEEQSDRLDDALTHYRRARQWNGDTVDYVLAEAECLAALGRAEEARELVTDKMGRFDSDGTLELLLAQINILLGDSKEALSYMSIALDRSGCGMPSAHDTDGCAGVVEQYGRMLSEAGRHVEAIGLLRPYVAAHDEPSLSVVTALCSSYLATGQASPVRDMLRERLRQGENHPRCWMLLARASIMFGDWTTARRCVDHLASRRAPIANRSAQPHLLRGFVCWKQDDPVEAEASLRRALSIDPRDTLAHCLMGQLVEEDQRLAAEAHYRAALEIDPNCAWARYLLGMPDLEPSSGFDEAVAESVPEEPLETASALGGGLPFP